MSAHVHERQHRGGDHGGRSLNRTAALATLHCLTGCAIGEVLGMVIGTALGLGNAATIALAVVLAFAFGYSLTMLPLLRAGLALGIALPLAFASDSFSIAVMETVDNGVMLGVPGAMDAPLSNLLFWGALGFALVVAYLFAFPLNRYLIARGKGHAVVHEYHHGGGGSEHAVAPARGAPSRRSLILLGLAAMAVTIAIVTGSALLVESRHDEPAADQRGEVPTAGGAHGGSDPAEAEAEPGGLAVAANGYALSVADQHFVARRARAFSFRIVDGAGMPVRDFEEHGGVRMHLIVVRRDLTGYQHLHPNLQPDGSWTTDLVLPEGGTYRAFADFERDGEKTVLGIDLLAAGTFEPTELPGPATRAAVDGYEVELDASARAGDETTIAYLIARDGFPVDVEPYLGAAGHLVALRQGDLAYLHVHPLASSPGEVRFAATFPSAGTYRLFLQFKDGGSVHTVPLTLLVETPDNQKGHS
jgi:uncharacterized protein DUF4396